MQGYKVLEKFMGRELGSLERPISAADRKLRRNKHRLVPYLQESDAATDNAEGFETVFLSMQPPPSASVPSMLSKPSHPNEIRDSIEVSSLGVFGRINILN